MSGSAVKKPRLTKEGNTIKCKTDNIVPLVVPGLSTSSGSNSSSTSTLEDLSPTSPAQERSDGLAPEDWCGSLTKNQKQNKKRDGNRDSDDRLRDLPEWLEEFTDRGHRSACTRTNFSGLRFGTYHESGIKNQGSTVFILTPQGLLAEDALAKQYLKKKSLVT